MTNDFVALLKDSSLVSVLTVVELTKQTQIFATNLGSWVIPGTLCAALYLAMSLPLAALARRLERRWKAATHEPRRPSRRRRCRLQPRRARRMLARRQPGVAPRRARRAMGPSGSGKTTILRAIAGLEPFERGPDRRSTASRSTAAPPIRRRRCPAAPQGRAWCSSSTACSSTCRRSRTSVSRRCTCIGVRVPEAAERRGRELLSQLRRRASRRRAAARAVGRRSAARGDRARAGGRIRRCC